MILLLSLSFYLSLCYTTGGVPISGCDLVGYFCYWRSNSSALTNYDAQAVCAADQGRLPIFSTSTDYNNFVTYKNSKTAISGTSLWLGYWNYNVHSASAPGSWSDKNGTGLSGFYTNWNSGEPNDASPGEKCVNLNGNMNDLPCTVMQNFVCQSKPYKDCNACQVSGSLCFFYSTVANSIESQSICGSNGATLPTFNNSADLSNLNTWMVGALGMSRCRVGYWNYAAHSASAPGTWQTQNGVGPAGPYLPWNTGEPNDFGGNEKCAEVVGGATAVLNDNSCGSMQYSTVCQCAAPPIPTTTLTCANCDRTAANCYLTINAAATNAQAKSLCSSAGGILATFKNLTELNSFRTYWWPRRTEPSGVWVGYWNFASHSASAPGIWTDQNGNPTSYALWNSGEPSDSHGNEKCVGTFPFTSGMNDEPCSTALTPTICDCMAYTTTTSTSSTSTSTKSSSTTSSSTTSTTLPTTSTSTTSTTLPTTSTSTTSTTLPTTSTSTTSTTLPTTSTSTTSTTLPTTSTSTTSTTLPTTSTSTTSTTLPTTSTSTTSTTLPTTSTSTTSTTLPTTSTSTTSTTLPTTSTSTTSTTLPTTSTSTTSTTLPTTSTSTTSTTLPTTSTSTTSTTLPPISTSSTSTTATAFQRTTSSTTTLPTAPTTKSTSLPTTSTSTVISQGSETSATAVSFLSTQVSRGVTVSRRSSSDTVSVGKATHKYTRKPTWLLPLLVGVISVIAMLTAFVCCWIYCGGKRKRKHFNGQTENQADDYI